MSDSMLCSRAYVGTLSSRSRRGTLNMGRCTSALMLTFHQPFTFTGNGYFSAWSGCFAASSLLYFEIWGAPLSQELYSFIASSTDLQEREVGAATVV